MQPNNAELLKLYNLLCSLIRGITADTYSATLRDGAGERFNGYLMELVQLTGDKRIADYSLQVHTVGSRGTTYVIGEVYARNLYSAVDYLFQTNEYLGQHASPPPSKAPTNGAQASPTMTQHVMTTQQSDQNTQIDIQFNQTLMQISETLGSIEHDFPDIDSKENKFAKALKKVLPTAKDALGIMSLILTTASQMGLSPHEISKLLNL